LAFTPTVIAIALYTLARYRAAKQRSLTATGHVVAQRIA